MKLWLPGLLILLLTGCRSSSGPGEENGKYILSPAIKSYRAQALRATRFLNEVHSGQHLNQSQQFDFTTDGPDAIRKKMEQAQSVRVDLYRPWWPWSKAVAFYDPSGIKLNTYSIERPDCQVINTLVHEWFHSLGYGHGSNFSHGKDNSVPYFMGKRAEELCLEGKI